VIPSSKKTSPLASAIVAASSVLSAKGGETQNRGESIIVVHCSSGRIVERERGTHRELLGRGILGVACS
jgi:hypothetical protein